MQKLTIALMVALALTGCGKNPTGTDGPERVVSAHPYAAKAPATAKLPASNTAAKSTSTAKAATTPVAKAPTAPAAKASAAPADTTTTTVQVADPNAPGSLAVKINVSGTAQVASLALKIFDPKAPDQALDAPLALTAGAASWSEKEVGAGTYTMQVKALAADGTVLGTGSTSAAVKAGEPTEVNLDLKVNTAADTAPALPTGGGTQVNTQSTGGTPTPTPAPSATPTPKATPTPAPTPTPMLGGTLGLEIEVL
jgi:hypothetical protein